MYWHETVGDALRYIEEHITEDLSAEMLAKRANISAFYFQKGFAMLCGFTLGEYIRNRRLALAANDLAAGGEKVIDIALKYCYDSPDSFAKAFTRFHGVTPSAARKNGAVLKSFAPLKIKITLEGGELMDYKIEKKEAFSVIARAKSFDYDGAKNAVPLFWQEHYRQGGAGTVRGVFGINIDETMAGETFEYLIADPCAPETEAPQGFCVRTVPAFTWAVFPCRGAMPNAVQKVNEGIYAEWLPSLKEYEFAAGYCVEFYDNPANYKNGTLNENYYCEIWIPVKKK